MGEVVQKIIISNIECHGLRDADFLSKNDPYVIFKVGAKSVKTKYKSGAGKDVVFPDKLEMIVSDADLAAGLDITAYDYDVGPDPDDLLGVGKFSQLTDLKQFPDQPRHFESILMYKGRNRGTVSSILTITFPHGGAPSYEQAAPVQAVQHVGTVVPSVQQQSEYMLVQCPTNATAGMQVTVQAPSGQCLTVVIPQGVSPGGNFRVPIPKTQQSTPIPGYAIDVDGDGKPDYYIPAQSVGNGAPPPPYVG
uniref:C2 domain-containing protein n=1 Tax=Aureoumbra lagunensis TaxID=44058 RepID=A0A6S8CIC1_9STRA|mmetsp:Transcript_11550/g.15740  ORF Transcript_11550/g.15740 Transcript_11550/m.15740 type:complete len:250 (-) Transcript_11550:157-906(-)|eukprot:CAMPEP_0197291310 /NCGR_PEP_ID=MMETSP0890-20130614/13050_1 /TAXON_ID=44058 ORGANISM="Aureoumbra lagunensis, Strain CCMP1510" /NCGR_SAMPLE_ID=MMETSP0890 /ASSEMBLY_ACC=CAM_ASM_000533 /LENGTH=249 /DNA_ID=CAMNT_0042764087 /DNA_START=84 /DNA_END=833 /DNA_ORIENTATION=+